MSNWLFKSLALIFILFAGLQYNDPDGWLWIFIYLIPAIIAIMLDRKIYYPMTNLIVLSLFVIGCLSYTPDVIDWIQNGTPSITGSMKAESPFIEFIREFFGLLICVVALLFFYKFSLKMESSQPK